MTKTSGQLVDITGYMGMNLEESDKYTNVYDILTNY